MRARHRIGLRLSGGWVSSHFCTQGTRADSRNSMHINTHTHTHTHSTAKYRQWTGTARQKKVHGIVALLFRTTQRLRKQETPTPERTHPTRLLQRLHAERSHASIQRGTEEKTFLNILGTSSSLNGRGVEKMFVDPGAFPPHTLLQLVRKGTGMRAHWGCRVAVTCSSTSSGDTTASVPSSMNSVLVNAPRSFKTASSTAARAATTAGSGGAMVSGFFPLSPLPAMKPSSGAGMMIDARRSQQAVHVSTRKQWEHARVQHGERERERSLTHFFFVFT